MPILLTDEVKVTSRNLTLLVDALEKEIKSNPNFELNMEHYGGIDWVPFSEFKEDNIGDLSEFVLNSTPCCALGYGPFSKVPELSITEYDFEHSARGELAFCYPNYCTRVFPALEYFSNRFLFGGMWFPNLEHFKDRVKKAIEVNFEIGLILHEKFYLEQVVNNQE